MISVLWRLALALTLCVVALPAPAAAAPDVHRPTSNRSTISAEPGVSLRWRWLLHRQRGVPRPHVGRERAARATVGKEGIPTGRTSDPLPGDADGFFLGSSVTPGVTQVSLSSAGLSSEAPAGIQPARAPPIRIA